MQTPEETIELVKKWLNDRDSICREELRRAAYAYDAESYYSSDFISLGEIAAHAVANAVSALDCESGWAIRAHADNAAYCVKEFETLAQKEG